MPRGMGKYESAQRGLLRAQIFDGQDMSPNGRRLSRMIRGPHGQTLSTTTYAAIASVQLIALFVLWTPSGNIWWQG